MLFLLKIQLLILYNSLTNIDVQYDVHYDVHYDVQYDACVHLALSFLLSDPEQQEEMQAQPHMFVERQLGLL